MKKINLGLLFGGRSCEHAVSVTSARSIRDAMDPQKYQVSLIGIDQHGRWRMADDFADLLRDGVVEPLAHRPADAGITLELHHQGNLATTLANPPPKSLPALDVIFPALHGTFGEDGTLQGLFEMAGIPYVGCGVAASALAMDKALAKKIFAAADIPQVPYLGFTATEWQRDAAGIIQRGATALGYPMFVKPSNLGSSVGISKVHQPVQLKTAIEWALRFDTKILLERAMENCAEVECAVLGNHDAAASVVGEIIPGAEFYDYTTKYLDDKTELVVPAKIDPQATARVRELALAAFREIGGAGLARVDFFVDRASGQVTLNEVNTLPGFTPISMYPRLWAASGVPYGELIDRLIELALEMHRAKAALQRTFEPADSP